MNELEVLKAERTKLINDAKVIDLRIREIDLSIANKLCPYSVGAIMVNGRRPGKRARITAIKSDGWRGYKLIGVNIRKDGSDGAENELYSWDNWTLESRGNESNKDTVQEQTS